MIEERGGDRRIEGKRGVAKDEISYRIIT